MLENITEIYSGLSLSVMKCQQFLECVFFLFVNCLSGCFGGIAALSVENRCRITPARGTGNFGIIILSSGNRHKFTSMFKCASLVHPCTSVACCQTKFQVPLTVLEMHPHFSERCSITVKHEKDGFHSRKKNICNRTVVFYGQVRQAMNTKDISFNLLSFPIA